MFSWTGHGDRPDRPASDCAVRDHFDRVAGLRHVGQRRPVRRDLPLAGSGRDPRRDDHRSPEHRRQRLVQRRLGRPAGGAATQSGSARRSTAGRCCSLWWATRRAAAASRTSSSSAALTMAVPSTKEGSWPCRLRRPDDRAQARSHQDL